jgi:CRP-like cAMP-binding protein
METTSLLENIPLFSHLDAADLERIAHLAQFENYQKGQVIIREHTLDNRLFVLIEGRVAVVKDLDTPKQRHLQHFEPYAHLGEMSLIDESARSASVVADTDVEVLTIDNWDLKQEIRRNPNLGLELLKNLSWRLRAMNKIIRSTLGTMAPICAKCHKIRDNDCRWITIERYIQDHSEIEVNHSICPECSASLFPQFYSST